MITSRPVDIAGRFVGVAVSGLDGWHFRAVDPQLDDIDGARFSSPAEAARVARLLLERDRGGHRPAGSPATAPGAGPRKATPRPAC
ncbi:hypothetical protein CR162_09015 [Pseudoroseomonas rhizosphaerae]|uniref:Uncharacterized protein n=1 Tax=Teichococcus rhizosphaerae TaxID=1335062 RepID=A0A2C6Z9W0_9PROT|nr:hypothetical protein [Pseudoroseomonas rhizosphaerae]PHK95301.1 hypothetical protein CR162_09015 [Pseudoroseomonas rhizosphaerae]